MNPCAYSLTGSAEAESIPAFDALPLDAGIWRPNQWRAKITRFRPGGFEITVRAVDREAARDRFAVTQGFGFPVKRRAPGEQPDPDNVRRARNRSKTKVRHLAKNMGVSHLLTLSTRQTSNTRDEILAAWSRFLRLYSRVRGERLDFIAVIERHPTNREHLHLHAAVTSFLPVNLLRRLWYIALGGNGSERGDATPGGVHMRQIKAKNANRRAARISRYIAKYMTKDTAEEFNKKRYSCSRGAAPDSESWWLQAPCGTDARTLADTWSGMVAELLSLGIPLSFRSEDLFIFPGAAGAWFQWVPGDAEDMRGKSTDPPPF